MTDKQFFSFLVPLSNLIKGSPFKNPQAAKSYVDYLRDLQVRLWQYGIKASEDWAVVMLKYNTYSPIYIGKEFSEASKKEGLEGDYYSFKTSIADIDKIICAIKSNPKIR